MQAIEQKCEEHDVMLQKILSAVENLSVDYPSRFQSKSVRSMRFRLKKAQLDNPSNPMILTHSNSVDESPFPLLPQ